MRNQEAKVERALSANTAGLSRDVAQCSVFEGLLSQDALTTNSSRPMSVLTPHQVSAVVTKVSNVKLYKQSDTRPFLPSDLYQKGLFLETATSCYALGKKASHTLLLFLNISEPLGCVLKYL